MDWAKSNADYKRVREHLLEILNQNSSPRGRLPPERDLAESLSVGRSVTRRVFREFETLGLIHRHVGRGTFIGPARDEGSVEVANNARRVSRSQRVGEPVAEKLEGASKVEGASKAMGVSKDDARQAMLDAEITSPRVAAGAYSPAEYIETRLRFEPELAWMIVAHATAEDLDRIQHHMEQSDAATTMAEFESADANFHSALVDATHNRLTIEMYRSIDRVRRAEHQNWSRVHGAAQTTERRSIFTEEHKQIFDALVRRDAQTARDAWANHLRNTRRRIIDF